MLGLSLHSTYATPPDPASKTTSPRSLDSNTSSPNLSQPDTLNPARGNRTTITDRDGGLCFITFTNPGDARKAAARTYARNHAMKNHHARRKSAKDSKELERNSVIPRRPLVSKELQNSSLQSLGQYQPISYPTGDLLLPPTYFGSGLVDDFDALPLSLSHNDRRCLDRYIHFAYQMDSILGTPQMPKPYMGAWLPDAVKDPVSLYDILLTGAHCLQRSAPSEKTVYDNHIRVYKGHVLRLLNEAVADKTAATRDSTIAGLVKLQIDEYLDGNFEGYELHAKGLRTIIELRGGLGKLGMQGYLSDVILRIDKAAASHFSSTPYYTEPFPTEHISVRSLNPGFHSQAVIPNLTQDLILVLNSLCTITAVLNKSGTVPEAVLSHCEPSVHALTSQRKVIPLSISIPEIQECTCLAAQIFWQRFIRNSPGDPSMSQGILQGLLRLQFLNADVGFPRGGFRIYLKLLLWVAFVGSSDVASEEEERDLTVVIGTIAGDLELWTWDDVRTALKSFLWLEGRSEELWSAVWWRVETSRLVWDEGESLDEILGIS